MKHITKTLLSLLTLCALFAAHAETLTIEGDLGIQGALETGQSVVRRSSGGENVYFKWNQRVPYAEVTSGYDTVDNQTIYIEFDDVYVWGAITVTVVGDYHSAKTTGMIRKTFAIGRNPGWTNGNDGEQLEVALGPIVDCYKLGSASSESGKLRIPLYKIKNKRNRVTVFVEGHLSLDSPGINVDPASDISLTAWEVVAEDHIAERVALDVESATVNGVVINPLSDYSELATPGGLYYDIEEQDFKGHNGTGWVSLTSGGSGGTGSTLVDPQDPNNVAIIIEDGGDITVGADKTIDLAGSTTVSGAMNVTGTITMATAQGDISMGAFTAQ